MKISVKILAILEIVGIWEVYELIGVEISVAIRKYPRCNIKDYKMN